MSASLGAVRMPLPTRSAHLKESTPGHDAVSARSGFATFDSV